MTQKLKRAELSVFCVGGRRCHKRELRVTFGPETGDGTYDCSELGNEKFDDLTSVLTVLFG